MNQSGSQTGGWLALLLLALMLPFELDRPLLTLGPVALTNVELLQALVLFLATLRWWRKRPKLGGQGRTWLLLPATVGIFLLTAVLAPDHTGNALKATLRLFSGILLALAVPILLSNRRQRNWLIGALLLGGVAAAGLGLAEIMAGYEFAWLAPLRSGTTVTGEFMRLTSPFDYANQATMYLEAIVPLLLVGLILAWRQRRHLKWLAASVGLFLLLLLCLQASFLTLSRSGFATIALVGGAMAILLAAGRLATMRRPAAPWLGLSVLVLLLVGLNTAANDVFRLRFASEGDNDWYRTRWQTPETLTLVANEVQTVPVTVTNEGALTWRDDRAQPIHLGGRWILQPDAKQVSEPRWPFGRPIAPGETAELTVPVRAPTIPGEYTLIWDVVHEEVTWFGAKSGVYATSQVTVRPSAQETLSKPETAVDAWIYPLPIPPRRTLWRVALQQIGKRPLRGIGLDNFRLTYGAVLAAERWNETIHTNNWVLEFLVGGGVLGGLLFFAWFLLLGLDGWRRLRTLPAAPDDLWPVGILAGLLAFAIHGLLDFFLLFNATGLLFWLLVGLYWHSQKEHHAYRD